MGEDLSPVICIDVGCCPFKGGGSVVVDLLSLVVPIVCWGSVSGPCFVIQYFVSSF